MRPPHLTTAFGTVPQVVALESLYCIDMKELGNTNFSFCETFVVNVVEYITVDGEEI